MLCFFCKLKCTIVLIHQQCRFRRRRCRRFASSRWMEAAAVMVWRQWQSGGVVADPMHISAFVVVTRTCDWTFIQFRIICDFRISNTKTYTYIYIYIYLRHNSATRQSNSQYLQFIALEQRRKERLHKQHNKREHASWLPSSCQTRHAKAPS